MKYMIYITYVFLIFSSSTIYAKNISISCDKPSYFSWNIDNPDWKVQKSPNYRELIFQIDFDFLRSRVKYNGKWFSWIPSTFDKELVSWKYNKNFEYTYNISKKELIERQKSLLLKYIDCKLLF